MSYSFTMSFCEVKNKTEAFDKALAYIKQYQTHKGMSALINNRTFPLLTTQAARNNSFAYDQALYVTFTFRFVYFPKHKILGLVGEFDDFSATSVYFQNSTDQDYDYEEWNGISLFEKLAKEVKQFSPDQIVRFFPELPDAEIRENLEYWRRTCLYQMIYEGLHLNKWLYRDYKENAQDDTFITFDLFALNSPEKFANAGAILRNKMIQ